MPDQNPTVIRSAANQEIKALRALETKKGRSQQNAFVSEGLRHVVEAVRRGWRVNRLVLSESASPGELLREAIHGCEAGGGRVLTVTDELMTRIARRDNAQSVIAVIEQRWGKLESVVAAPGGTWLALEGIRDPGNLGSIVRSSDAFAVAGVLLIGNTVDPFSTEAVRASMGSIVNVPLIRLDETAYLDWHRSWTGRTVGTHLRASLQPESVGRGPATLLVMGNEQSGLPARIAATCTRLVRIPMRDGADSLNLAAATAIMLYAVTASAGAQR
ncbi:RNA methyltransferase [Thalassobaculum sp.]|uniref:TrmH family RNA methyltransferase n=1 Tax=Thalassobaculum sp. TaxID=2022740 RepID=UPI0032EB2725